MCSVEKDEMCFFSSDDFFMGLTELFPEESNLPFWVWVDECMYTDTLGIGHFLRFQPNRDEEKLQAAEKYPILMLDSLVVWNLPDDFSLSNSDMELLRKWVVLNRENLKLLSQRKITREDFLRSKSMKRFVEQAGIVLEMSVSCEPKDTGLPMLIKVNVGENSSKPFSVVFYPYRASPTGAFLGGVQSSKFVVLDLDKLAYGALPKDASVTSQDIDRLKKWARACKPLIKRLADREITQRGFIQDVRKVKV